MKWVDNIKIRNKLIIVFGILLSFTIFFAIYVPVGIVKVGKNLNELINSSQARQIHIANAITDFHLIRLANISKWYTNESTDLKNALIGLNDNYSENIRLFHESLNNYCSILLANKQFSELEKEQRKDKAGEIISLFTHYITLTEGFDRAVEINDRQAMIHLLELAMPIGNAISAELLNLRDLVFVTTKQEVEIAVHNAAYTINTVTITSAVFLVLAVIVLALFTVRSINQPIFALENAVKEIADGNLSYPIRSERKDELGSLSNCVADMIEEIMRYSQTLIVTEKASAAKTSFLANMSHEIRTPMNAILGITEIQLHDKTLAPDTREAFIKIYNAGDLLLSIINDILDLSKIEAGKMELLPLKYDVASLINDTVHLNIMRISGKPIEFALSVDEKTPSILIGDGLRIKQILNNLLSNAFKYTEQGIVKLSVSVEAESEDDDSVTLIFGVSDTGQGMSEEQVDKLFDQYTRFNEQSGRTTEGTGLGMSITQNLVNMMSGTISVKSELNWGSIFTVRLPQKRTDSRVLGMELAENLQNFQLDDAKQLNKAQIVYEPMPYGRVLIVDDVESNLYVARGLLAPYGLSISTATSGFEAIEKIKDGNVYDIVFMDHMMPKMDGMEATEKIHALGYMYPIVALTANAVVGQAEIFLASGFDDFISKPIDMRQLSAVLKKFIRDKQPPEVLEAVRRQVDAVKKQKSQLKVKEQPHIDPQLAQLFVQDATRSIAVLGKIYGKIDAYSDEDIRLYTITTHAMKSALANIGTPELAAVAARLEQAGRDIDTAVIALETPAFIDNLRTIIEKMSPPEEADEYSEPSNEDIMYLREQLFALAEACEAYDQKSAKAIVNALRQKNWPHSVKELLGKMAEYLLNGDFKEVSNAAEKITKTACVR